MLRQMSMVESFMRKVGAQFPTQLAKDESSPLLSRTAIEVHQLSQRLMIRWENASGASRELFRAALLLEEVAELIEGLAAADEVAALDGLADSLYVLIGTALQFDLPIDDAFDEVHRSNMTKDSAKECRGGSNGKGGGYSPPNLRNVLDHHKLFERIKKAKCVWREDDAHPHGAETVHDSFNRLFGEDLPSDAIHAVEFEDVVICDYGGGRIGLLSQDGWTLYKEQS